MASHSPTGSDEAAKVGSYEGGNVESSNRPRVKAASSEEREYVYGWAAMTKLMHQGYSWSGRERKCCYLNLGDKTFATVSASSGLDFDDDGRAVAVCDWDGDGDLDLWLKNRTGPQLRFMRNNFLPERRPSELGAPGGRFLELDLVGKTCNRDAIGAQVELVAGYRRFLRFITAGDGYLSQSSKRLHFGLAAGDSIDSVTVHWPGGEKQSVGGLALGRRFRIEQGTSEPTEMAPRAPPLTDEAAPELLDPPNTLRLVLRVPLPLPPTVRKALVPSAGPNSQGGVPTQATLIVPWILSCAPCISELSQLAESWDAWRQIGLSISALNVDSESDRGRAEVMFDDRVRPKMGNQPFSNQFATTGLKDTLDALWVHVQDQSGTWPLPMSLLADAVGNLQVIYFGPVSKDRLKSDVETFCRRSERASTRGAYHGRWYFKIPRNYSELSRDLERRGCIEDSQFYQGIAARSQEND